MNNNSFLLGIEKLKEWKENNKFIDFTKSQIYIECCLEVLANLKATLDIAIWKKEITEVESIFFLVI